MDELCITLIGFKDEHFSWEIGFTGEPLKRKDLYIKRSEVLAKIVDNLKLKNNKGKK